MLPKKDTLLLEEVEFLKKGTGIYTDTKVETFDEYIKRFEWLLRYTRFSDDRYAEVLLSLLKLEYLTSLEIYINPLNLGDLAYEDLKNNLRALIRHNSAMIESHREFFGRVQLEDELVAEYMTALKNLAKCCRFNPHDHRVRDTFISGLRSDQIRNEISKNQALDEILKIALDMEDTKENTIEQVPNQLENSVAQENNIGNSTLSQNSPSSSIDQKEGTRSDKLKANLPEMDIMMECIVELQWNTNCPNSNVLNVLDKSRDIILLHLKLSEITCIFNRSEPGKVCCAVYTSEMVRWEGFDPLVLHFFDEEKLEDWFQFTQKVLLQVKGIPKIPQEGSIWSTTAKGEIYVSDVVALQSTSSGKFVTEYDFTMHEKPPFEVKLINGFPVNTVIAIHGYHPSGKRYSDIDSKRIFVKLICGLNKDVALQINPRYDDEKIVRDSFIDGRWGEEESGGGFILKYHCHFTLSISCLEEKFQINVNGRTFTYYNHRISPNTITDLEIGGNVEVSKVLYQSNKVIVDLIDMNWRKIPGKFWKVETCSAGITWGLSFNYVPFVFVGNSLQNLNNSQSDVITDVDLWEMLNNIKLRDLSLSVLDCNTDPKIISLWAVSTSGNVLHRYGISTERPQGERWIEIQTDQLITCIASDSMQVWCVGEDGICYRRTGISATKPTGEVWESVEPVNNRFFTKLAIGKFAIWALDHQGDLFIYEEAKPDVSASDYSQWRRAKHPKCFHEDYCGTLKHISANGDNLWALCARGMIYRRLGICKENPEGVSWVRGLNENFLHLSE